MIETQGRGPAMNMYKKSVETNASYNNGSCHVLLS